LTQLARRQTAVLINITHGSGDTGTHAVTFFRRGEVSFY